MKLLVASTNEGKCREIRRAFEGLGLDLVSLRAFPDAPAAVEDGATYEENSWTKARHYHEATGLPAIADDSGLEVERLGGKPGVHSARFAGETTSFEEKNERLLELLKAARGAQRTARFVCVVSYIDPDGACHVVRGECRGRIADSLRGDAGFGYDPVFVPDGYDRTFAELGEQIKNEISHRAHALRTARAFFVEVGGGARDAGCRIVAADAAVVDDAVAAEAASRIRAGQLVAYPTDTLYGLGADATSPESVARVAEAKGRESGKPISVIADTVDRAFNLTVGVKDTARHLAEAFWPGPLTLVVDASPALPAGITAGTGKVGVRVPDCALAREIVRRADAPVTATSANLAGQTPARTALDIVVALGRYVSLVLDCGTLDSEPASTVVDVSAGVMRVLRRGAVSERQMRDVVGEDALED